MHMSDALISPIVGGTMWVASAGAVAYSIKKVQNNLDEKKIPLMGVLGAFVFAAQMINFSIPGTGSSGHIGGGMLLAVLLGPYAGLLSMTAILTIQAIVFGDGGLLALGCNIFNLGVFTCFIAYPLIYKPIVKLSNSRKSIFLAASLSAVLGLQMGSFGVVLETLLSGKTDLPFSTFVIMMQLIHLAIGALEGLVTAAIVSFIYKERPEILENAALEQTLGNTSIKKVVIALLIATIITGGLFSWFASSNPDGLEWSILKSTGNKELSATGRIHEFFSKVQNKLVVFPDYDVKTDENKEIEAEADDDANANAKANADTDAKWPDVSSGKSFAGFVGGLLTLTLVVLAGLFINLIKKRTNRLKLKNSN